MTIIKVPATTANLGPGFDSIGMALSLYLELEILEAADHWYIEHDLGSDIPHGEENLVIQIALSLKKDLPPHRMKMTSEIPSTRGLGSSSAAIVAGIELAVWLGDLSLTNDEKIQIASKAEGHPDNVMPAIVGDCAVGAMLEDDVRWMQLKFPEASVIVTVPNRKLLTADSRSVLPESLSLATAVKGSSVGNMLIAAISQGDLALIGYLMEQDVFHEPYRSSLIPELSQVRKIAHEANAYGTYLSGAGTTIITLTTKEKEVALLKRLQAELVDCDVFLTTIDRKGAQIIS